MAYFSLFQCPSCLYWLFHVYDKLIIIRPIFIPIVAHNLLSLGSSLFKIQYLFTLIVFDVILTAKFEYLLLIFLIKKIFVKRCRGTKLNPVNGVLLLEWIWYFHYMVEEFVYCQLYTHGITNISQVPHSHMVFALWDPGNVWPLPTWDMAHLFHSVESKVTKVWLL